MRCNLKFPVAFYTGYERCVLVAHDWGGVVASHFTGIYPDMVEKLILINIPYFTAFLRHLRESWGQTRKSWWDWGWWSSWRPGEKHNVAPGHNIFKCLFVCKLLYFVILLNLFARVQLTPNQPSTGTFLGEIDRHHLASFTNERQIFKISWTIDTCYSINPSQYEWYENMWSDIHFQSFPSGSV